MHSMAALAADTTPPPTIGGTGLLLAALVVGILFSKRGGTAADTAVRRPGKLRAIWSALVILTRSVVGIVRFYGGREMRGEPRSTATFWCSGVLLAKPAGTQAPAVAMASIALAPPRVSLVKTPRRQPRPWARTAARWIETYRGKGATALDRTVRTALWTARTAVRVWSVLKAIWAGLRAAYVFVAPIVVTLARVTRMWHCWPYAARGLARLAMTAAALGLLVPAWRGWTLAGLALAAGTAVVLAHRHRPKPPGDDVVYGPRLWVILRDDLNLPDDEPRENWLLLPERLGADGARIALRLPWTFRGSELERQQVTELINSRLPGDWVGRYSFTGETFTAVYTHKPPPKPPAPEPECPEGVGFFDEDIQEAIANCKKGEIVVGKDTFGNIVIKEMGDGETPHWALSVGTGGGKSAFCQMVIAQLVAQGYYIFAADVKRVSVSNYIGVVGCYIYNDPMNPQDMRNGVQWFVDEISARSAISEADPTAEFPGILCLIEEANEFADVSREWWDDNRKTKDDEDGPKDRAADPIWGTVASGARLGRHVHGNILAVFQDLRDQALGGKGLRNLFRLKFMGNFSVNSWNNVIGTKPVPDSIDKAGRMMIVEGNSQNWVQTLYATPDELRAWAIEQRERTGFVEGAGLFGTPPKRSPKRLPRLLAGLSRDELPEALQGASEGGLSDETAGGVSRSDASVTLSGGSVTGLRDGLRLIPGQGGQEAAQDPTAPPELLSLAEIARRLEDDPNVPKDATLRAHKARRDDFPQGIGDPGKELYTVSQIQAYYERQEKRA
ncbi:hypothetical protein ACFWR9_40845 [Streptomyces sp. NPDC058534]|uniref:hypothetical protein n=1 Tax=Streptomyces sp. NPDC058534 TaxID=3346541 RepID=UPI00365B3DD5